MSTTKRLMVIRIARLLESARNEMISYIPNTDSAFIDDEEGHLEEALNDINNAIDHLYAFDYLRDPETSHKEKQE